MTLRRSRPQDGLGVPARWYVARKATRALVAHKVVPNVPKTWHKLGGKLIVYEGSND